jgi:hypothetical protein
MPIYEDLNLRREGEGEGEGVYIQEIWSCDVTRDSSLSGNKLARHRSSAVTMLISSPSIAVRLMHKDKSVGLVLRHPI